MKSHRYFILRLQRYAFFPDYARKAESFVKYVVQMLGGFGFLPNFVGVKLIYCS